MGDRVVLGAPGTDGYSVLVPNPAGGWQVLARLWVEGVETRLWAGNICVSGDGSFAAVTYFPFEFTNDPELGDRGAFAATINLGSGAVSSVPERVDIYSHSPGCGIGSTAVFSRYLGTDQAATQLLTVDHTGIIRASQTVRGQVTSAVPTASGIVAASGPALVRVANGATTAITTTGGTVFDVRASADGGADLLSADTQHRSEVAYHVDAHGHTESVATAALGGVAIETGRGGRNRVVGQMTTTKRSSSLSPLAWHRKPETASIDGSVVVDPPRSQRTEPSTQSATAMSAFDSIEITAGTSSGATSTARVNVNGPVVRSAPSAGGTAAAPLAANVTTPTCAVAPVDYTTQVMQPGASQVVWAADNAIRGALTVTRPANWNDNGLPAYTPQGLFPRVALSGGGRVPLQVLLGIMAQESNFWQASGHALPGVAGDPLINNYYGTVHDPNTGLITGMDYDSADCGYGIAQVTSHMTATDPGFSATQKKAIATDYAANMSAALQILAQKWNESRAAPENLIANTGDPQYVENWYFAIWDYNCCLHGFVDSSTPYGLGWTNNPANADYTVDRSAFLQTTYDDARHPQDWPYQERVLGFAGVPLLDPYQNNSYAPTPSYPNVPSIFTFCQMAVDSCDKNYTDPDPKLDYCTLASRECWWHGASTWASSLTPEVSSYVPGTAEGGISDPYPPDCTTTNSTVLGQPDVATLPAGPVVVDDVPNKNNIEDCTPAANSGTFSLGFATDSSGAPLSKIDFHQLGVGYGGHIWFAHTVDAERTSMVVTGTWTPPSSVTGWQRIWVHIPDNGAMTYQANYHIVTHTGDTVHHRVVNQRWNQNGWVDLGSFNLSAGAKVWLDNTTFDDFNVTIPNTNPKMNLPIDIAWDAVAFTPSSKPVVSYVSLGDSYAAGEGLEPYYPNSDVGGNVGHTPSYVDACHRSPTGWPQLVYEGLKARVTGTSESHNIACSGATIDDVLKTGGRLPSTSPAKSDEPPQDAQGWLDENTTNVTLSISGNDAKFADVLAACFENAALGLDCANGDVTLNGDPVPLNLAEPARIDQQLPRLQSLLTEIRAQAPNARIALVAYPHPVNDEPLGNACITISADIDAWFAQMTDRLDDVERQATAGMSNVYLADPRSAFAGHGACTTTGDEWINATIAYSSSGSSGDHDLFGVGIDIPGAGSFHPKLAGMPPYANSVLAAFPVSPK